MLGAALGRVYGFSVPKGTLPVRKFRAHFLKIWKKSVDDCYFLAFTENSKNLPKMSLLRRNAKNFEKLKTHSTDK